MTSSGLSRPARADLAASVNRLDASISSLESQISLVQDREAAVRQSLAADRARLAALEGQITRERDHLAQLRRTLAKAKDHPARPARLPVRVLPARCRLGDPQRQRLQRPARAAQLPGTRQAPAAEHHHDHRGRQGGGRRRRQAARPGCSATVRQITAETQVRAQALAGMNNLLLLARVGAVERPERPAVRAGVQPGPQRRAAPSDLACPGPAGRRPARRRRRGCRRRRRGQQQQPAVRSSSSPVSATPSGGWAIP